MEENILSCCTEILYFLSSDFSFKGRRSWSQILRKQNDSRNLEESGLSLDAHASLWCKTRGASFFIHFITRKNMNRGSFLELYCLPIEFNFCPIEKTHILLPVISVAIQQAIEPLRLVFFPPWNLHLLLLLLVIFCSLLLFLWCGYLRPNY
jgi:hypothetical protein